MRISAAEVLVRKSSASRAESESENPNESQERLLLISHSVLRQRQRDSPPLLLIPYLPPDPCRPATMSRRKQSCPQHLATSKLDTPLPEAPQVLPDPRPENTPSPSHPSCEPSCEQLVAGAGHPCAIEAGREAGSGGLEEVRKVQKEGSGTSSPSGAMTTATTEPQICKETGLQDYEDEEDEEDIKTEERAEESEEQIKEYLKRTDTAVIFPEPVSVSGLKDCLKNDEEQEKRGHEMKSKVAGSAKPARCPHCGKLFRGPRSGSDLEEHIANIHAVIAPAHLTKSSPSPTLTDGDHLPGQTFQCCKCKASFTQAEHFEKHQLVHALSSGQRNAASDESQVLRKFKCPECGKAFKFKHHLKEHIRIHSGEKPFVCSNCSKRFSHSGSYSSHMTSKKCLVMNLKGRKGSEAVRSSVPIQSSKTLNSANNSVPGGLENNAHNGPLFEPTAIAATTSPSDFFRKDVLLRSLTSDSSFFSNPHFASSFASPRFPHDGQLPVQALLSAPFHPFLSSDVAHNLFRASGLLPGDDFVVNESMKRLLEVRQRDENGRPNGSAYDVRKLPFAGLDSHVKSEPPGVGQELENNCIVHPAAAAPPQRQESKRLVIEVPASVRDSILRSSTPLRMESDGEDSCQRDSSADDDGPLVAGSDGKKARVRSVLSEETLQVLRSQYNLNPRPKKNDILRLAQQVNYSTRVVQVWFQNMRARDRRLGRPVPNGCDDKSQTPLRPLGEQPSPSSLFPCSDSSPVPRLNHNSSSFPSPTPASPKRLTYSPSSLLSPAVAPLVHAKEPAKSDTNGEKTEAEQPLDLSCRSGKVSNKRSSLSPGEAAAAFTPINLSYQAIDQASRTPINQFIFGLKNEGPQFCDERDLLEKMDVDHVEKWNHSSLSDEFAALNGSSRKRRMDSSSDGENNSEDGGNSESSKGLLNGCGNNGDKIVRISDSSGMESGSFDGQGDANGLFSCDQCDKTFSKQSSLARHKYEHSGQRPHKCDVCTKAFKHKHHLTEHKRLHSGEKPFQCKKCLKRFSHSGSYSQHMNHRYSYCKPYRE